MIIDVLMEVEGSDERRHRQRLENALRKTDGIVRVASAYVTEAKLLASVPGRDVRLLTHLERKDIILGATSLDALEKLIKAGVQCRCVARGPRLHAKVYMFDEKSAVVTSANLTSKAMDHNIEVGVHISGTPASKLVQWFDRMWNHGAYDLDLRTLERWKRETAEERAAYSDQSARIDNAPMFPSEAKQSVHSSSDLSNFFKSAKQFFICNTNRRHSESAELRMHQENFAAAWEEFRYPSHMKKVEKGDAIFIFAKGHGIIGLGRAKDRCEVLQPGDSARIRGGKTPEWRVPVEWMAWVSEDDAKPYNSPNSSFFDVSTDRKIIDDVASHFRRIAR